MTHISQTGSSGFNYTHQQLTIKYCHLNQLLYSENVWRGESLGGEWFVIRQTNLVLTIDNLLADLLIRKTLPLYGTWPVS